MRTEVIVAIIGAVFASNGLWQYLIYRRKSRDKHLSNESKMIRGLSHDRICFLSEQYIKRGSISRDEYENLHNYLYEPYVEMGGNGVAQKLMQEVEKLPIK